MDEPGAGLPRSGLRSSLCHHRPACRNHQESERWEDRLCDPETEPWKCDSETRPGPVHKGCMRSPGGETLGQSVSVCAAAGTKSRGVDHKDPMRLEGAVSSCA